MATIYGAQQVQTGGNQGTLRQDAVGKNNEAFAVGDPVSIASGKIQVYTTTMEIIGVAAKTQTMSAANATVTSTSVYPAFIPADEGVFLMGTNSDLTGNATDGGTYYKLAGATGVVQVDVASGVQTLSSRQVEIVKVDPFNEGGTGSGSGLRKCLVRFVSTPYTNVAIN